MGNIPFTRKSNREISSNMGNPWFFRGPDLREPNGHLVPAGALRGLGLRAVTFGCVCLLFDGYDDYRCVFVCMCCLIHINCTTTTTTTTTTTKRTNDTNATHTTTTTTTTNNNNTNTTTTTTNNNNNDNNHTMNN